MFPPGGALGAGGLAGSATPTDHVMFTEDELTEHAGPGKENALPGLTAH